MEPAVSRSHADETARGGSGHGAGLLEASVGGLFPHMAPDRKASQNVGLDAHQGKGTEYRAAADERQGGKVARAQIGDHQEGNKEDGGGAKVTHQSQAAHAGAGQDNEQPQISFAEQPVQGGGSGKDVADLGKLRRLEGESADADPVGRTVFHLAKDERQAQKEDGSGGHEPTDLLYPLQIPEKQPQNQEEDKAQHHREKLFGYCTGRRGRGDGEGQRGQEKGHGLDFKANAAQRAHGDAVQPHYRSQAQKGAGNQQHVLFITGEKKLQGSQNLEKSK